MDSVFVSTPQFDRASGDDVIVSVVDSKVGDVDIAVAAAGEFHDSSDQGWLVFWWMGRRWIWMRQQMMCCLEAFFRSLKIARSTEPK